MTWQDLLARKRVQREPTDAEEIRSLRKLASRNLADASVVELSVDGRFEHAYSATRALATIVVRASGYRVRQPGAHYGTFQALEAADPAAFRDFATYFDSCRTLRNRVAYDLIGVVTEGDLREILEQLPRFERKVIEWIVSNRPELQDDRED